MLLIVLLTLAACYLVGAIPFGYLIAKWRGVDIFAHGSGNIGATNVGRVIGARYGILVLILDALKGAVPAAAGLIVRSNFHADASSLLVQGLGVWSGLAAILGHMFSPYLGFRGGKGVATGGGVVLVVVPLPAACALLTWLAVVCASRFISLGSLVAAVVLCLAQVGLTSNPFAGRHLADTLFCFVTAALVFLRHRHNILRLVRGDENRLQETSAMLRLTKTVHVMSLGFWFGMSAFFIIVALSLFNTFESIGEAEERPTWFPATKVYQQETARIDGLKEQGSRAAGAAVAPLFDWLFLLQGICGFLALTSSLGWAKTHPQESVHRIRSILLLIAFASVVAGWPIEQRVSSLRVDRNAATYAYLVDAPSESAESTMVEVRQQFATWHLISLALNFVTLIFVMVAMAQAAFLPSEKTSEPSRDNQKQGSELSTEKQET